MTKRSYATDQIRVLWNSELCIHSAICLNSLPSVFDARRRPWIEIAGSDADSIARAVERCPSGALTYERLDGAPAEQPPDETVVVPWPNGPLLVRGRVEVRDTDGRMFTRGTRMALCRCGNSQNQPFCDLSHRATGFRSHPRVVEPGREAAESPSDISPEAGP
jgi:uncharacterized Fe-S cluster protein YjdI/CDGSH-type Zn-finger protein